MICDVDEIKSKCLNNGKKLMKFELDRIINIEGIISINQSNRTWILKRSTHGKYSTNKLFKPNKRLMSFWHKH